MSLLATIAPISATFGLDISDDGRTLVIAAAVPNAFVQTNAAYVKGQWGDSFFTGTISTDATDGQVHTFVWYYNDHYSAV